MALRLIDLRQAALYEYPEFGWVPWPEPWYSGGVYPGMLSICLVASVVAVVIALHP